MKEQIIINGNLINFYMFNEKNSKNLIFLHGWRSNALAWNQVINNLNNEKIGLYALDLPGFGNSEAPKQPFNVDDFSQIIAQFIKKKNLKDVILVGHSVGGRIAIKLSATQPELISRVVLVDSAGFVTNDVKKAIYKKVAKLVKPLFKPKAMQGIRKKIYRSIGAEDYVETPELKETFLNIINEDLSECLPKIKQPTLIIWGEKDNETPVSFAEKMHKEIRNSSIEVIKDAGHFCFIDQPERFNQILTNFIGEE